MFSRAFSSEVQPVELARKLAKEMDAHQTASVSRIYVPNEYTVYISRQDRSKLEGYERSLEQELSGYLLEHARRRSYDLLTRPAVEFKTDDRLRLGEFGIQTRLVKPPAHEGEAPSQGEEGHTMVYSAVREREKEKSQKRPEAALVAQGRGPGAEAVPPTRQRSGQLSCRHQRTLRALPSAGQRCGLCARVRSAPRGRSGRAPAQSLA